LLWRRTAPVHFLKRLARSPRFGAKIKARTKMSDCTNTMHDPVEPLMKKLM
jgi:hypothetical protein